MRMKDKDTERRDRLTEQRESETDRMSLTGTNNDIQQDRQTVINK